MLNFLEMKLNLIQFNQEESIYKEYYNNKDDPEEIKSLLERLQEEGLNIWLPEGTNIRVMKHNRYTPLYKHKHDFFEMICILEGQAENIVNNKSLKMKRGDICIIAPGVKHAIGLFNDDSILINILIRKSSFKENFIGQLPEESALSEFFTKVFYSEEKNSYILFRTDEDEMLNQLVDYLVWEGLNETEYSNNIMENLLKSIFYYLIKNHGDSTELSQNLYTSSEDVIAILNYMQKHYATINLDILAQEFDFSNSHLSRLIKKHTGQTFAKILQDIKMNKSLNLLENSKLTIKEVSQMVGYESVEYFTRIFKELYGQTPSRYRQGKQN